MSNSKQIELVEKKFLKRRRVNLKPGDRVKVYVKSEETKKERFQIFEGIIIAIQHSGINTTFKVRKVSYGIGVERTFFLHSPKIEKIEVVQSVKTKRSKLYYLRKTKSKRQARLEALIPTYGQPPPESTEQVSANTTD